MLCFVMTQIHLTAGGSNYQTFANTCYQYINKLLWSNLIKSRQVTFRCPGAMHNARWMAKAIYCVKMFMFRGQFKLTQNELAGLKMISLFVSLIYAHFWHEAPLADHAPINDLKLLTVLHQYPVHDVKIAAVTAFCRHLWYLSEYLAPLALFDERLDNQTKAAMVNNLALPPNTVPLKRLNPKHSTI